MSIDEFTKKVSENIIGRCWEAIESYFPHPNNCVVFQNRNNSPLFVIDKKALRKATIEIEKDIKFIIERRKNLIGDNRLSQGKIAGAIAYRLSKANIFHICVNCLECSNACVVEVFNIFCPLKIALEYIDLKYNNIKSEVRKELIYSMAYRHTNQETLGLVFDILLWYNNEIKSQVK